MTLKLRQLSEETAALLSQVRASPRLTVHLRLVHDVACELAAKLTAQWPQFRFDTAAVAFGAATHDIGKAIHPAELSGAGNEHEAAGYALLIARGFPEPRARFARTHSKWADAAATTEDLLVSLADKIWKGRRQDDLEQLVVRRIAAASGEEPWQVFMSLDELIAQIASQAGDRLSLQAQAPVD
jgi:hypothetical protein